MLVNYIAFGLSVRLSVTKYHIYNVLHTALNRLPAELSKCMCISGVMVLVKEKSTTLVDKLMLEEGDGFGRTNTISSFYVCSCT